MWKLPAGNQFSGKYDGNGHADHRLVLNLRTLLHSQSPGCMRLVVDPSRLIDHPGFYTGVVQLETLTN